MSKIYFSRSMTRTLSADQPVGDPTGGAAYGEKNDPVSAIISIATMGGTYAAAGSFAAMTVMQGITFAGAALNLVGNVTGNKTLQKVGMVAGIAGGLGQLAGIQGPTLGQTFGKTGSAASNAATTTANTGSLNQSQAAGAASNRSAAQSYAGSSLSANAPVSVNAPVNAPAVNAPAVNPLNSGSSYTGPIMPAGADAAAYAGPTVAPPSLMSKAWETTKDIASGLNPITNPYGAMAVGQIAQPIADYLSGKTDAEIDALEAQTGYADARAMQMQEEIAREKRRRENLNAGYAQVNTGINVNPAVLGQAKAGGLISGAMQPAA